MLESFELAFLGIMLFSLLLAYVISSFKRLKIWLGSLFILIIIYYFVYFCLQSL
jgi:hypothetical protein